MGAHTATLNSLTPAEPGGKHLPALQTDPLALKGV